MGVCFTEDLRAFSRGFEKVGMLMKDNNKKLSPLFYALIGLIISALLGMVVSHLLLGKPQQYRENMLWKYTILLYALTMFYLYWLYFLENYLPLLTNLLKWIVGNLFLSLPYFIALVLTGTVSINAILTILPAQTTFLAAAFIWHVASEIDPELDQNTTKIWIKAFFIGAIPIAVTGFLLLPNLIVLFSGGLAILSYILLLFIRAKKNPKCSPERTIT